MAACTTSTASTTRPRWPTAEASHNSCYNDQVALSPAQVEPGRIKKQLLIRKKLLTVSPDPEAALPQLQRQATRPRHFPPVVQSPFRFRTKVKKPSLSRELRRVLLHPRPDMTSQGAKLGAVNADKGVVTGLDKEGQEENGISSESAKSRIKILTHEKERHKKEVLERAWGRSEESIIADRKGMGLGSKSDIEQEAARGFRDDSRRRFVKKRQAVDLHELEDYCGEGGEESIGIDELEREEDGLNWNSGVGIKIRGRIPQTTSRQNKDREEGLKLPKEDWEDVPGEVESKMSTQEVGLSLGTNHDVAIRISESDIPKASMFSRSPHCPSKQACLTDKKWEIDVEAEVKELLRGFREERLSEREQERDRRRKELNLFLSNHNTIPPPPDPLAKSQRDTRTIRNDTRPKARRQNANHSPSSDLRHVSSTRNGYKSREKTNKSSASNLSLNISSLPYIRYRLGPSSTSHSKTSSSTAAKITSSGGIVTISPCSSSPSLPNPATLKDYEAMGYIRLDLKQKKFVYTIIPSFPPSSPSTVPSSREKMETKVVLHTRPGVILKNYDSLRDVPVKHWPVIKFAARFVAIARRSVIVARVEGQISKKDHKSFPARKVKDGYEYELYRGEIFADGRFQAELIPRGSLDLIIVSRGKNGRSGSSANSTSNISSNSEGWEREVLIGTLRVELRKLSYSVSSTRMFAVRVLRKEKGMQGLVLGAGKYSVREEHVTIDGMTILWEGEVSAETIVGEGGGLGGFEGEVRWAWGVWGHCRKLRSP